MRRSSSFVSFPSFMSLPHPPEKPLYTGTICSGVSVKPLAKVPTKLPLFDDH